MESATLPAPARPDNRALILKSASQLFAERGFQATTLRDIAGATGANGALVSYYFGGKEGLREAVLSEKIHNIDHLTELPETGLEKLQAALGLLFGQVRSDPDFHRLAHRALSENDPFRARLQETYWQPLLTTLSTLLQGANPALSPTQTRVRAQVLLGVLQQYGNNFCFFNNTPDAFEAYVVQDLARALTE